MALQHVRVRLTETSQEDPPEDDVEDPEESVEPPAPVLGRYHDMRLEEIVSLWASESKLTFVSVQETRCRCRPKQNMSRTFDFEAAFQVFLVVELFSFHSKDQNILHMALVEDKKRSQVPSINVAGGTKQLVAHFELGGFKVALQAEEELQLRVPTKVRFQVAAGVAIFEVGESRVVHNISGFDPAPYVGLSVMAYLSGPLERCASATVSHVSFYAHVPPKAHANDMFTFALPAADKEQLDHSAVEAKRAAHWARFDSFFCFWLVVNAVVQGLTVEYPGFEGWFYIDNVFVGIFIIEWCLRVFYMLKEDGISSIVRDPWMHFDLAIIIVSALELWLLTAAPSFIGAVRLLRLLKLARLVRLFRQFRELGILLEGFKTLARTLSVAFCFAFLQVYCFSILLVQIATMDGSEDPALEPYTTLPTCLWELARIVTLDNWGSTVREILFTLGGIQGVLMAAIMVFCVALTGLGTFNIVIGILCQNSFRIAAEHRKLSTFDKLLGQERALATLKTKLQSFGDRRPLFETDQFIASDELFLAIATDAEVREAVEIMDLKTADLLALMDAFRDNGLINIEGLCQAISIMLLQACFSNIAGQRPGASAAMRPDDFLQCLFSLEEADVQVSSVDQKTKTICAYAFTSLTAVYARSRAAHSALRMRMVDPWQPSVFVKSEPRATVSIRSMGKVTSTFSAQAVQSKLYAPVDVCCGILLCINSLAQGAQVVGEKHWAFLWLDASLAISFALEFFWRFVVFSNWAFISEPFDDPEVPLIESSRMQGARYTWTRANMICDIFPRFPPLVAKRVVVKGFDSGYKVANGLYKVQGFHELSPYYMKKKGATMYLYSYRCPDKGWLWVIGRTVGAVVGDPSVLAWVQYDSNPSLPPLGIDQKWHVLHGKRGQRSSKLIRQHALDNDMIPAEEDFAADDLSDGSDQEFATDAFDEPYVDAPSGLFVRVPIVAADLVRMFRSSDTVLDFSIIMFTLADSVLLEIIRQSGRLSVEPAAISSLRVLRLVRLLMVLRLLKLFPQLQMLFAALYSVWRTVMWTMFLIMLVVYAVAIYMVVMIRHNTKDPAMLKLFGTFTQAIHSTWEVASFDDWDAVIFTTLAQAPMHCIPLFGVAVLIGVGFMKIAVGVMCESAISLSQRRTREHSEAENVIFVKRMSDLSVWVEEQLGSVVIPQEIMSAAMSMSLRPKAPRPDYQVPKELLKKGLRPKFLEALAKKLQDANMSKDLIWRIYDKMDINRRGFLTVDQLAKAGLLSTDNGLEAVLLFANSLTIINIQRKGLVLKETLEEASQAIAHLMEKTHMLMKSKAKADLVGKRKQKKHTSDPFGFGPKIREDIEEVAAFQVGAGTTPVLPEIEASGRLKENRGVGFIEISGHEVRGHSTDFVRQVQTGDLIAFDRIHGEERTTYTLVVSAICGPTMVKVDDSSTRVMRVKQGELFPYTIIRTVVGRGIGRVPCDASLQLVVPKAQNVSSRTAHMVFDWQLQSSSRHLARAWKKRSALWRKYMRLRSIVERLDDDRLLKGVIDAWRKETVENLAKTTKETSSIGYFLNSLTGVRQRNKAQHW